MATRLPSPRSMETEFLECRTIGHAWRPVVSYSNRDTELNYRWEVLLRCSRCNTERADLVDSQGRLAGRAYRYREGYRTIPYKDYGGRAAFTQQARVALFTRLSSKKGGKRG